MATRKGFQNLAERMINKTFGDFRDPLVLEQLGTFDYSTQTTPVIATDNTQGIRLDFDKSEIDGQNIQVGDYRLILLKQGLTVDVRADNVTLTFNGKPVDIINVEEDPANAVYTLQARDL